MGPFTGRHLTILVSVIVAVSVLLVVVTRPFGNEVRGPSSGQVPAPGQSFYIIGGPGTGLEIGDMPPPLTGADDAPLVDLNDRPLDLASMRGQPVWIVFWATWCPPCQKETPDLQRAWDANRAGGLQLLAVDVQENADIARQYAATYGLTYPIVQDPSARAFGAFGIFGLPTHYFIGRDGLIKDRWFGPLSLTDMQARIDAITAP